MDRRKLFVDVDGTITDSIKKICELYNEDYKDHPKFRVAKPYLVEKWDFSDQCTLINSAKIEEYFCDKRFFEDLQFIENANEVIEKLSEVFDIYVISMGWTQNLIYKNIWLKEHMPYIKRFIGCNFDDYKDKSHINMSGSILIDDSSNNLKTCNADLKILYGDLYEYNQDWDGIRKFNWYEIYNFLME